MTTIGTKRDLIIRYSIYARIIATIMAAHIGSVIMPLLLFFLYINIWKRILGVQEKYSIHYTKNKI